jgi:E3 ubiquitin-protein ligase CCNP1IP1
MFWIIRSHEREKLLTQHRFYQEFLGKALTEKYSSLSTQMDKVIHNANTEISSLQSKFAGQQHCPSPLRSH